LVQTTLFIEKDTQKHRIALIRTSPKDMRCQDSINLGYEIIRKKFIDNNFNVDTFNYWDIIDVKKYDIIGFNVIYLMNQLNVIAFFNNNNIPLKKAERENYPFTVGGGQGLSINPKPLSVIFDCIVINEGEDFVDYISKNGNTILGIWKSQKEQQVISDMAIFNKRAMIELTRGCRYRCNFCVYGWTFGKYREKDFELVKKQILSVKSKGIKTINFLSCNFAGYSKIRELISFCHNNNIQISNSDFRIDDYIRLSKSEIIMPQQNIKGKQLTKSCVQPFKTLKVGLESPDEKCRYYANKRITDEQIDEFLDIAVKYASNIHFYLIYGLPQDNYESWFDFIVKCKEKISNIKHKNIRIEFAITNFEPSPSTPFEKEKQISFKDKEIFLEKYIETLVKVKFINPMAKKEYKNMRGRIGRSFESYSVYMWLLYATEESIDIIIKLGIKGVSRSMDKNVFRNLENLLGRGEKHG
jgi:radical SAM superfamily enzyme YgiQ (UPF0313 family)